MKQLHLFNGEAAPKRKLTRKRMERMAEHAVPWVKPRRPKLPTAPLWRSLAKRGLYVLQGLIEKPIPRAVAKQPTERSGKVKYFEPYEAKTYDDINNLMDLLSPGLAGSEKLPTLDIQPTAKGTDAAFGRERAEELYAREQRGRLPGESFLHEAWRRQDDAGLTSLPPEKRPPINFGVVPGPAEVIRLMDELIAACDEKILALKKK